MFDLNVKRSETNHHLVLAHGAGAGIRHEFMQTIQGLLSERGINTWTFNFSYMQKAYAQDKKVPPTRLPKLTRIQVGLKFDIVSPMHSFGGEVDMVEWLAMLHRSWNGQRCGSIRISISSGWKTPKHST